MKQKLIVKWSKKEKDFIIYYPRKCDGWFVYNKIIQKDNSFLEELETRGYDLKTLKFSIEKRN